MGTPERGAGCYRVDVGAGLTSLAVIFFLLFQLGGGSPVGTGLLDPLLLVFFLAELLLRAHFVPRIALLPKLASVHLLVAGVHLALLVYGMPVDAQWTIGIVILPIGIIVRVALLIVKLSALLMPLRDFFSGMGRNPAKTIVFGFGFAVFLGALLLSLPPASAFGKSISFLDALFTSTSAVCVTGLAVVDTGTHFSTFGQAVLLVLIQAGGLGIMTLAVFIGIFLRERLSIRERAATRELLDQSSAASVFDLVRRLIRAAFLIEMLGAVLLFLAVSGEPFFDKLSLGEKIWWSLFHAVSAFCNAGFSLNADSLMPLVGNLPANLVFAFLITVGGLGFIVLITLRRRFLSFKKKRPRIGLQPKVVLLMSVLLVLIGAILFFSLENDNTLAGRPLEQRLAAAVFQSVTARTAGFNTVDTGLLRPATLLFMLVLMFIGASPGSTGGGIKTTTFFLVIQSIRASLRERREVVVFRRRIPHELVNKALAITGLFLSLVVLACGGILLVEPHFRFEQVLFETVSAAATVGLSTGITGELSSISRSILIAVMLFGRIGPLTMLLALTLRHRAPVAVVYPEERLMVG